MLYFVRHLKIIFFTVAFLALANSAFATTYYIGVSLPLSDGFGESGENMVNAIKLFVDQFNEGKRPEEDRLKLIVKDDKNDPEVSRQIAQELVQEEKLLAVIGSYTSDTALAAADIYNEAQVVFITPNASNPAVTKGKQYVFSTIYNDDLQGGFLAVYLKDVLKKDEVIVIHSNTIYGNGLNKSFVDKADRIGLDISKNITLDGDVPHNFISDKLDGKTKTHENEAVVIFTHANKGVELVKQLRDHGIDCLIMGPDTFYSDKFLTELEGRYTRDLYATNPFFYDLENEKLFDFVEAYKAKYKESPNMDAPLCGDAAMLLGEAIKANGMDRKGIEEYLISLNRENAIMGLTGYLFFDINGSMQGDVYVSRIEKNRYEIGFTQLKTVHSSYVLEQLDERVAMGYILVADGIPYHIIDVIFVGVDFFRINYVDTKNMNFDAELFMWFKWKGENVDVSTIDILNGIYGVTDVKYILKEDLSGSVKYRCYRVKGTYLTPYDLRKFPFDTQELPLIIADKTQNATHVMLVPDLEFMSTRPIWEIYPQEWKYVSKEAYSVLFRYNSTFGDPDYKFQGVQSDVYFSAVKVITIIKRILFSYLLTLFTPLLILVAISLLIFWIPIENFAVRLTTAMTALLSILVFQMSMQRSLPNVGYLIKSDIYFFIAYIFIFAVIGNVILVNALYKSRHSLVAMVVDKVFACIFTPVTIGSYLALTFIL